MFATLDKRRYRNRVFINIETNEIAKQVSETRKDKSDMIQMQRKVDNTISKYNLQIYEE